MGEPRDDELNPGSDEAIKAGCTCPVLDNAHGRGYMGVAGIFVYRDGCPLHWPAGEDEPRVAEDAPVAEAPSHV